MSYKVIVDSCGELTEQMKESGRFVTAPLQLQVEDHIITDDDTFDQAAFLDVYKRQRLYCSISAAT